MIDTQHWERGSFIDRVFTHQSRSSSRLQAQLEAERAARAAGYPTVARLHAIKPLSP